MRNILKAKKLSAVIICVLIMAMLCACQNPDAASSAGDSSLDTATSSAVSETTQVQTSSEDSGSSISSSVPSKPQTSSTASKPQTSSAVSKPSSSSKPTTSSKPQTSTPEKTPAQKIVGIWRGSVDMAPLFSEQGIAVEGEQIVSCDVEYTSDGVMKEVIDRNSLEAVCRNVATKALNDSLAQNNLTKEQFEASAGITCEQHIENIVQTAMGQMPETIVSAYKFEGNDFYVKSEGEAEFEKVQYSFSGENKLTIVEDDASITYTRIG